MDKKEHVTMNNHERKFHVIIPARYSSSRFPGKPLALLNGRPMFWHVWNRASSSSLVASVTLATDDERILHAANELHVPVVMTAKNHESGTDRVFEAATKLSLPDTSIIINVQGDEPALDPKCLDCLIALFNDPEVRVGTLARSIPQEQAFSPDTVKVVVNQANNALYFSRSLIPFERDPSTQTPSQLLAHMGVYAFTMQTLREFVSLPVSPLEQIEKLEQLRLLDNGIAIRVGITKSISPGVDRQEDLEKVLPLLENFL